MRGFALLLAILLLFILTVFGFSILLLSTGYYSSVKHAGNTARLSAESALHYVVARHNYEPPGFFFRQNFWIGNRMIPFNWADYTVAGELNADWNHAASNRFTLTLQNKNYRQSVTAFLQSRRLEHFALFSDAPQLLPSSSLFQGKVFVRGALDLSLPEVRFLDSVQADVNPLSFASFARSGSEKFVYPSISSLISWQTVLKNAIDEGMFLSSRNPLFWDGSTYSVDLSKFSFERQGKSWLVAYDGQSIGISRELHLAFDADITIRQSAPVFTDNIFKQTQPLAISCAGDVRIESAVASLENGASVHPLLIYAADAVYISADLPSAAMIDAMLVAAGADTADEKEVSLLIDAGGVPLSSEEKEAWLKQAVESEFLFESAKRTQLETALQANEKIVLFQQAVIVSSAIHSMGLPVHLHFRAGSSVYPLVSAFSYIDIERGGRRWQ